MTLGGFLLHEGRLRSPCVRNFHPIVPALGIELRAARERAGITRRVLAYRLGVSENTLLTYEHGIRELQLGRFVEFCEGINADPVAVFDLAVRRVNTPLGACPTCRCASHGVHF